MAIKKKPELRPGCLRDLMISKIKTDDRYAIEYNALCELLKERLPEKLKDWYFRHGATTLRLLFEQHGIVSEYYERKYESTYGIANFDTIQVLFAELNVCWSGMVSVTVDKWTENIYHAEWRLVSAK